MFGGEINFELNIGILYDRKYGFIGFLVKLNVYVDLYMCFLGFFIVVYVVIKDLDKLYN